MKPINFAIGFLPLGIFYIGRWIELVEMERMAMFRDKSALYGRELKPGEKPSWPKPNYPLFL